MSASPETIQATLDELLDHLEGLMRQDAFTDPFNRRTTSQALSEHADALRILDKHGRFRIAAERGPRIVAGYWPEHDPLRRGCAS